MAMCHVRTLQAIRGGALAPDNTLYCCVRIWITKNEFCLIRVSLTNNLSLMFL